MDRNALISLLRQHAGQREEPTPFCPDDHEIAAFVDGTLSESAHVHIEHHLPDCRVCINRVGSLTRLMREPAVDVRPTRDWRRSAPKWATAASVFLAIGYFAGISSTGPTDPVAADYRPTRTLNSTISAPEILASESGLIGERDDLVIRWTEVPGTLYYEVRVVSDVGDFVSAERVTETQWAVGSDLGLEPDNEYFVRVDAFLTDSKSISSSFIPMKVAE